MKKSEKKLLFLIVIILLFLIGFGSYCIIIKPFYKNSVQVIDKVENSDIINIDTDVELSNDVNEIEYEHENINRVEQKEDEIINVLLVGMDARKNETKSRSDTIILVSYNKTEHLVKMVSFLRDTWVYIYDKGWGRINTATAYGGIGLLINTLNEDFDLDIQNYVQIKFEDFKEVIDILGGIDIELSKSEIRYINNKLHTEDKDWNNDVVAEPGIVHLNGIQTLWHCRNRSIGEGDFSRTDRQREVLDILMNQCLNMPLTELPISIYQLKDYVDMNIPLSLIINIGKDALISKDLTVESYRIPFDGYYNFANKNGASVIEIDLDKTKEKLHEILGFSDDKILDDFE